MDVFPTLVIILLSLYLCEKTCADEEITDQHIERRVNRVKRAGDQPANIDDIIKNLPKLQIATLHAPPYVYFNNGTVENPIRFNKRFTGFLPDLIAELSNRLGFKYNFFIPEDRKYGTAKFDPVTNKTTWSGMINEVLKSELPDKKVGDYADIAACDITITRARSEVVDFLQPFAHVGLTAIIQKPHRKNLPANVSAEEEELYFEFNFDVFKPLTAGVWIMVTVLLIVVWLFNWLMNMFNPYEYGERYKRNLATEDEARLFNLSGSLWYTFTLLQWQGYDRAPRSIASKMLGCIWMVFVTVTLVTYIGSFINILFWASMAHGQRDPLTVPIKDLRDLANQADGYNYGAIRNGSTHQYLTKVARGSTFRMMARYLEGRGKDQLVNSVEEGVEKARNEKYAFIMETPRAEHIISNPPCDMMKLDIEFAKRSYGLAVAKSSPIREPLHNEVIEMLELGVIESLERRWFDDQACYNITVFEKVVSKAAMLSLSEPKRVSVKMFWSPLLIMILGIVLSFLVGIAEIFWYKYRGRYEASNRQRGHQLTNEDDGHI